MKKKAKRRAAMAVLHGIAHISGSASHMLKTLLDEDVTSARVRQGALTHCLTERERAILLDRANRLAKIERDLHTVARHLWRTSG